MSDDDHPLPWFQVIPLVLLQFCEAFNNSSIYSYLAFLVIDFTDSTRDSAGNWAGFVASAVYVGCVFSSYLWGWFSDRYGKRPCLILGSSGTLICVLLFGFTFNIYWAIAVRFLAGILNGNLGVVKGYLAAITNSHNQTRAFSIFFLAVGVGAMSGSSIGGFLARPAVTWPHVFNQTGVFGRFPYLLPNLITAFVVFCGLIGAIFFLPEIKNVKKEEDNEKEGKVATEDEDVKLDSEVNSEIADHENKAKNEIEEKPLIPVWKQSQPLLICLQYTQLGFLFIIFEEIVPLLFTATRPVGGLDFSPPQIGTFLLILGAFFILVQPFVSRVPHYIGSLNTHRLGVFLLSPVILSFPLLNLISNNAVKLWSVLVVLAAMQALADALSFTTVMIMINNSVDVRQFGEVNGIAQTGVALLRAMAPVIGGPIFAWSLKEGHSYPFNYWFLFLLQFVYILFLLFMSSFLKKDLNYPLAEVSDYAEVDEEDFLLVSKKKNEDIYQKS